MEYLKEQTVSLNFRGGGVVNCNSLEKKHNDTLITSRMLFTGVEYFCEGNEFDSVSLIIIAPDATSITPVNNAYIGSSGFHQFYRAVLEENYTIRLEYANKGPLASKFRYNLILHSEIGG